MKKYLIIFIAALAASLAACSDDPTNVGFADNPGAESAVLQLSIAGADEVAVYSTGSTSECEVKTLYLFVFRNGSLVHAETHVASSSQYIFGNGTSQLTVSFSNGFTPQAGDKVYVIANPPSFTGSGMAGSLNTSVHRSLSAIYVGSSISEAQFLEEYIAGDNPFLETSADGFSADGGYSSGMPMFGSVEWQGSSSNMCLLVRSVAKVRIDIPGTMFDGKTVAYGFAGTPTGVGIGVNYNSETKKYEPSSISSRLLGLMRWGSVPTGGASTVRYIPIAKPLYPWPWPNATKIPGSMGSSLSSLVSVPNTKFDPLRCALMLRVTDQVTNKSEYFRLDFARNTQKTSFTQNAEHEYMNIDPNTNYTFSVVPRPTPRGYTTEAEAWQNPGSNLEYTLDVTNGDLFGPTGLGYVVSNGQYGLCFSEKEVQVRNDDPNGNVVLKYCGLVNTSTELQLTNRTVALVGADKKTLIPSSQVEFSENSMNSGSNPMDVSAVPFTDIRNIQIKTNPSGSTTPNPLPAGGMYLRFVAGNITEYIPVKCNTFRVTLSDTNIPYNGGNVQISVTSYSGNFGTDRPQEWITEYSTDEGRSWSSTKPSWLTGLPASDPGSLSAKSYSLTVTSNSNPHTSALKSVAPVTNYDLSTNGGTTQQNTANCYLVNAPGSYRLPLVYGNAIKGGATNSSAYTSTASGPNILKTFVDHENKPISGPYISTRYTPSDCCLVWQDADELVSNVHLSNDGRYLEFEVLQTRICEGNAVVAVRDASNRIMWSWHIWVTDYVLGTGLQPTTNYQNKTYYFLPYNIGWCDESRSTYPARSVKIRFTQTSTNAQQIITIKQTTGPAPAPSSNRVSGNNVYFQWGRKDPMLPGLVNGSIAADKPVFNGSGYTWGVSNLGTALSRYILTPHQFNTNSFMDNKYFNLWSANNNVTTSNDDPVTKTIYDPSPVGFCMPPSNAWTGFTTTGEIENDSLIRGTWDNTVSPAGYKFNINEGVAYYPASGCRTGSGKGILSHVGDYGLCWSAVPGTASYGRNLVFYAGSVDPQNRLYRNYGLPVRPVKE